MIDDAGAEGMVLENNEAAGDWLGFLESERDGNSEGSMDQVNHV